MNGAGNIFRKSRLGMTQPEKRDGTLKGVRRNVGFATRLFPEIILSNKQ